MLIAAAVLAGLLALALGTLAVPVDVEVRRPGRGLPTAVRIGWLAGRVEWEPAGGEERPAEEGPAPEEEAEEEPEEEERARRRGPKPRDVLTALRTPGLGRAVGRLLSRLSGAVRLRRAVASVRLGDPADTGRLWGLVGPVVATLPARWRDRIDLRPDFSPGTADVAGRLRGRVVPLRLVAAALGLVLSPPVIRAGWRIVRSR